MRHIRGADRAIADAVEKGLKIDVNIIVEYGARIPDVAYEIQNRVKKAIENMTGLSIDEVNVHIHGVNIDMQKNHNNEDNLLVTHEEAEAKMLDCETFKI